MAEPTTRSGVRQELQTRQRAWLQQVIATTGKSSYQISTAAGVSDTTLSRLLNKADYSGVLSQVTIDRIKETFKVPGPEDLSSRRFGGFAEGERFDLKNTEPGLLKAVQALVALHRKVDPWRLKTAALEQVGYLAGDIVLVDLNCDPAPQDAVCAQTYDLAHGQLQTIFRVYDPPFLVAAAQDRTAYKPLLIDNDRVVVKGVIVESVRPHRLSALR